MMAVWRKEKKRAWGLAVVLGILLALFLEGGFGYYHVNRGYGEEGEMISLVPDFYTDYMVSGDYSEIWTMCGAAPFMTFHPDRHLGHIQIEFLEPLAQETEVYLYYSETEDFDRYQRTDGYLLQGTEQADITIPPGEWKSLRLDIRGHFVLKSLKASEMVPLPQISVGQVVKQISWARFLVLFLVLSASVGLLVEGQGEKALSSKPKGSRNLYFDGIRTLAAVLVIVIHVLEPMEGAYSSLSSSKWYVLFLLCMMVSYSCNQLFLMLSGALLLPYREESVSVFVRKRVLKVVLPLFVYGFLYVKLPCFSKVSVGTWIGYYLKSLCTGQVRMGAHLWLVYELISLYILVVPLRELLKNVSEKTEKQLALLTVLFWGSQTMLSYFHLTSAISSFLNGWIGIFLMGYFLTRPWMRKYDWFWLIGGVLSLFLSVSIALGRSDYKPIVSGRSVFGLFIAGGIFVVMMHLEKRLGAVERILIFCSNYSYSVLLIHWYVLYHIIFSKGLCSHMSNMEVAVFSIFACLGLSLILSVGINKTWVAVLEKAAVTVHRIVALRGRL